MVQNTQNKKQNGSNLDKISSLIKLGKEEDAAKYLVNAINLSAEIAWNEVALIQIQLGQINPAIASLKKSLDIKANANAYTNLGHICRKTSQEEQAIKFYQASVDLNPNDCEVLNALGHLCFKNKSHQDAFVCFTNSITLQPQQANINFLIANILNINSQNLEAQVYYERELKINPSSLITKYDYGNLLHQIGDSNRACEYYKLYAENKKDKNAYSFLLYMMHHANKFKNQDFLDIAKDFYNNCFPELANKAIQTSYKHTPDDLNPDKTKIRVGFVSKYFLTRAGERWILELLKVRNLKDFEVYVYHDNDMADDTTQGFKDNSDNFKNINGLTDKEFAETIAKDKIDVMVDLLGHVRGNRLGTFALKPAPVQVSWFGYFGTTGLPQMDYLFADAQVIREGEDKFFVEKIHRLPNSYCFFKPDDYEVEIKEPPVKENGYITFGSFHRFSKVNSEVLELWLEVLKSVNNSRLLLKANIFKDLSFQNHIKDFFVKNGIESTRILIEPASAKEEYLNTYNRIDISLDSFPYGGGTTTMHSIWMGVPVISLEGDIWTFRGGGPLYNRLIGHSELVVQTKEDYIKLAQELSNDIPRLENYRKELRAKFLACPVCDAKSYMKDIENGLRTVWQETVKS